MISIGPRAAAGDRRYERESEANSIERRGDGIIRGGSANLHGKRAEQRRSDELHGRINGNEIAEVGGDQGGIIRETAHDIGQGGDHEPDADHIEHDGYEDK